MNNKEWQITNANIIQPEGLKGPRGLMISRGRISDITMPGQEKPEILNLNLNGLYVYPSLINSFDSLLFTYDAIKGSNWPYLNWLAHDNEVKLSKTFKERTLIDPYYLYLLGAYKNLFSGAAFVVDHIPHFARVPFQERLPVSLLNEFGIAHSISTYSPLWGEGLIREYAKAVENDLPFITRAGEGFDLESKTEISRLHAQGALGTNTVLVNCLSVSENDLDSIAKSGANIVWCPSSNRFLYNEMAPIHSALDRGINVSIGTNNSISGSSTLLQEMKTAGSILKDHSGRILSSEEIFKMVTSNASSALRQHFRGKIAKNNFADLLVLSNRSGNPYDDLLGAEPGDIFLLVHNGIPLMGDISLEPIFNEMMVPFEKIVQQDKTRLIISGLEEMMWIIQEALGYNKKFNFLPFEPYSPEN